MSNVSSGSFIEVMGSERMSEMVATLERQGVYVETTECPHCTDGVLVGFWAPELRLEAVNVEREDECDVCLRDRNIDLFDQYLTDVALGK